MPIAPPRSWRVGNATVYHGDCRKVIPALDTEYNLIFADPPFNIGQDYQGYSDLIPIGDFLNLLDGFIAVSAEALKFGGILALHGPDELVEDYMSSARASGLSRIAWVNWHYRFGQCNRSNWIDSRCHCLFYTQALAKERRSWTWNPDDVLVDSDRKAVYEDPRVDEYERGGQRLPFTIWGIPSDGPYWGRVQGNNAERRPGHPNQLPEVYLARIVKAYTNTEDAVLEVFGGSGGFAVVSAALGRYATTIDVSEANCLSIVERLKKGAVRV